MLTKCVLKAEQQKINNYKQKTNKQINKKNKQNIKIENKQNWKWLSALDETVKADEKKQPWWNIEKRHNHDRTMTEHSQREIRAIEEGSGTQVRTVKGRSDNKTQVKIMT